MLITREFELVVCSDADGGLRISPTGTLGSDECQRLNEAIIGALRSGVPRLEIDTRQAQWEERQLPQVLRAAAALARHLDTEFRVTGITDDDTW
jgi:hypothetical protein